MNSIPTASWRKILDDLRRGDPSLIRAWFYSLDAPDLAGGVMTIRAQNDAQKGHLDRCAAQLARNAQSALGRLVSVNVVVSDATDHAEKELAEDATNFRSDFTLDRFLVAPENQMAHAAALRALERGASFNPLFLHGPRGAGKTHLLQGLCWTVLANDPAMSRGKGEGARAVYRSAGRFVAEFTESFDAGVSHQFRRMFAQAVLVAIDDVEEFSGKSRSQEELFHIVNTQLAAGRQLVLAADRPPAAIHGLAERLVSRFASGLVIAMDSAAEETRLRILEQKNESGSFGLPGDVLAEVAKRCTPADLDALLPRLDRLAASSGGSVTMDLVDDALRGGEMEASVA